MLGESFVFLIELIQIKIKVIHCIHWTEVVRTKNKKERQVAETIAAFYMESGSAGTGYRMGRVR